VYRFSLPSEDCGYDGNTVGGTEPTHETFSHVDCTPFWTGGTGTYQNWTFNYSTIGDINMSTITELEFDWVGQSAGAAGTTYLQLYNWNTSTWDNIGDSVTTTGGVTAACGNNIYIERSATSNLTSYVRNNTVKTRFKNNGNAISTDFTEVIFHNNGSVVADLRGSSEVHVNNFFNQTSNLTVNVNGTQIEEILSAIASVNTTLNTSITNYLIAINGTTYQINQSLYNDYLSLLAAINSVNSTANQTLSYVVDINNSVFNLNQSEFSHFQQLISYLNGINITLNTTLEDKLDQINSTVSGINQTLVDEVIVLLKDINLTTNTTLENKLDFINSTTWQTWITLQNITLGNVTVFAEINWTEGLPYIWNASGQNQINYSLLELSNGGIDLTVETLVCADNSTLIHTMNVTNCIFGQCLDSLRNITETCVYGCANNQCIPAPTFQYAYAIGLILIISGFIYLVWRSVRP
jgi:hypothetical protein